MENLKLYDPILWKVFNCLQSHYEEAVYFLLLSSHQGIPVLRIQHPNHYHNWEDVC